MNILIKYRKNTVCLFVNCYYFFLSKQILYFFMCKEHIKHNLLMSFKNKINRNCSFKHLILTIETLYNILINNQLLAKI